VIVSRRDAMRRISGAVAGLTLQRQDCTLTSGGCTGKENLAGFESFCFTDSSNAARQVYVIGTEGPPVLLLHEISGLTPEAADTARQLAAARHTVLVPLFFGRPGRRSSFSTMWKACADSDFACDEREKTSRHVTWLRELVRCARVTWPDGRGVGAIGMCLTGAFPIALLSTPEVVAPVLCQPTVPFNRSNPFHAAGWGTDQHALGLHPDDLRDAQSKSTAPLLGIRYKGDGKCKKERFERLTKEFPGRFFRLDVPGKHHSTLAAQFCPDAFLEVLAFFNEHLRAKPDPCIARFPRLAAHSMVEVTPSSCRGSQSGHHGTRTAPFNTTKGPLCSDG